MTSCRSQHEIGHDLALEKNSAATREAVVLQRMLEAQSPMNSIFANETCFARGQENREFAKFNLAK